MDDETTVDVGSVAGDDDGGSSGIAGTTLNTVDLGTGATTGPGTESGGTAPVKRGRGRPPGSGAARTATVKAAQTKTVQASVSGIEQLLFSIHAMASTVVGEEFAIPRDEAKIIAEPLAAVAALYPNSVISPKVLAWTALGGAIASVHGPRFAARMLRMKMERDEKIAARANAPRSARPQSNTPAPVPAPASNIVKNAPSDVMSDPSFIGYTPERSDH